MEKQPVRIDSPSGTLGVLLAGLGAVSTTFIAGVEAVRRGIGKPFGSMTQVGRIRLGKRTENKNPFVKEFVPIADLSQLRFLSWDPIPDNAYDAAKKAGVLDHSHLEPLKEYLSSHQPLPAVFDAAYVRKLDGRHVKKGPTKMSLAEQLTADIKSFVDREKIDRCVMIWCGSTEVYTAPQAVHLSLRAFEEGLRNNDPGISPSMIYAYAALRMGIPYANGAPNLAVDTPALQELALETGSPIAGKDFKTGQTLMKTIIAPGLRARHLGISGWYSTNILGNRDGEVLDDPDAFRAKEESKLSVLETILQPELHPELYGNVYHKVRINYYPPRGDNKEGWDNIDIFGWLGYPMQIKIDFLCRDSILAAPLVLDLALFMDLAKRSHLKGIQEWLSFYFKSPMVGPGLYPEHNIFTQEMKLRNTLRYLMGEEQITHLGIEYYR